MNKPLPGIEHPVTIDATSQQGYTSGNPVIILSGATQDSEDYYSGYGFSIHGVNVAIRGLGFSDFRTGTVRVNGDYAILSECNFEVSMEHFQTLPEINGNHCLITQCNFNGRFSIARSPFFVYGSFCRVKSSQFLETDIIIYAPHDGNSSSEISENTFTRSVINIGDAFQDDPVFGRAVKNIRVQKNMLYDSSIYVRAASTRIRITENNFEYTSYEVPIILSPRWESHNDLGDSDIGANNQQNDPVILEYEPQIGYVRGKLKSSPLQEYRIEFYSDDEDTWSQLFKHTYLNHMMVQTDENGIAEFQHFIDSTMIGRVRATATDSEGNTSQLGQILRPSHLAVTPQSSTELNLTWTTSSFASFFKIERKTADGAFEELPNRFDSYTRQFTDTGLTPNTTYTYRIRAYYDIYESDYSNEAFGTTAGGGLIRVDANRDGTITFDDADKSTAERPYRFWINNDFDWYNREDEELDERQPNGVPNSSDSIINTARDLEDFTRLHIRTPEGFDPLAPDSKIKLKWEALEGQPGINLFRAVQTGAEYLTDVFTAIRQINDEVLAVSLRTGTPETLSSALFSNPERTGYFLFEGVSEGQGYLTVTFSRAGETVAEDKVYLELKDINRMYDHWTVGDNDTSSPHALRRIGRAEEEPELKKYILFVHGWRLEPWERRAFAETAYKRLWHQGYKGGFGLFSWPTEYTEFSGWIAALQILKPDDATLFNYDRSDLKAYQSASGLLQTLTELNALYPGEVRVLAHSMGNIVTGEALRQANELGKGQIAHTYVATQAASPAQAYDARVPDAWDYFNAPLPDNMPNVFKEYPIDGHTRPPYFAAIGRAVGTMVNFYNPYDMVLWAYKLNQRKPRIVLPARPPFSVAPTVLRESMGKPNRMARINYLFSFHNNEPHFYRQRKGARPSEKEELTFPRDTYEIFAHAAPVFSKALGAQENVGGPFDISKQVNLGVEFGWDSFDSRLHSAQFRSTIVLRHRYWTKLLETFGLR